MKSDLDTKCTLIADAVVPEYRDGVKSYSCTGTVAKRWQAAWDAANAAFTMNTSPAKPDDPARPHIVGGKFQSDKYPMCPAGKVPLSVEDPTAQDLLWEYAHRRRSIDAQFDDDLEWALSNAGFDISTWARQLRDRVIGALHEHGVHWNTKRPAEAKEAMVTAIVMALLNA